jgi:hypothetical protein
VNAGVVDAQLSEEEAKKLWRLERRRHILRHHVFEEQSTLRAPATSSAVQCLE